MRIYVAFELDRFDRQWRPGQAFATREAAEKACQTYLSDEGVRKWRIVAVEADPWESWPVPSPAGAPAGDFGPPEYDDSISSMPAGGAKVVSGP